MANFTTHIAAGTVVSGALATLTLAADVVSPENVIAVTLAGVLGSVLPDIDLKESRPSRAMFAGLAVFLSFAVLFTHVARYSIAELWILWLGTLVFVRYGMQQVFHRLAVHRGTWHSILAALFCSVATAVAYWYIFDKPDGVAWLAAGFMMAGYLVHLTLDEIYSVDVLDTRVKASFGTALKLVDTRHPYAGGAMLAATIAALWLSPPTGTFLNGLSSRDLWASLNERLMPQHSWFGIVPIRARAVTAVPGATPAGSSAVTTGSIREPTAGAEGVAVPQAENQSPVSTGVDSGTPQPAPAP